MIKASALYIVIVIALVIGLLCSSLIVAAYFFRIQYQHKFRYDQLESNAGSGITILLNSADTAFTAESTFSLFHDEADSVSVRKLPWGIYDIGIVKAFIQKDTLFRSFSFASTIDSTKWAALYLIDEDRPVSLSGKTLVKGDVYLPKAGIQAAYVDNQSYQGDKRLVIGTKRTSERKLPALSADRLIQLEHYLEQGVDGDSTLSKTNPINIPFFSSTRVFNFKKKAITLDHITISGNVILLSDTTLTIDSSASLKNIQVYARSIIVRSGFHGNAQLFAADSVSIGQNCTFDYPSCLGVLRLKAKVASSQQKIALGQNSRFSGIIFSYDKTEAPIKPLIVIDRHASIRGQVYSQGILQLNDQSEVDGSVCASRFWYKNAFTLYENYLINTTLNAKALSSYYLSSDLLPSPGKKKKILQWLEGN